MASVEKSLTEFAAANDVQGVMYLLGCESKKLDKSTKAHEDLVRMAMPLFLAAKHFNKNLFSAGDGSITFLAVITRLDGAFGYKTDESYDPVTGAINGMTYCLRKELTNSVVKLVDFAPETSPHAIAKKTLYEILDSDSRLLVGYHAGKRWTLISKPFNIKKER